MGLMPRHNFLGRSQLKQGSGVAAPTKGRGRGAGTSDATDMTGNPVRMRATPGNRTQEDINLDHEMRHIPQVYGGWSGRFETPPPPPGWEYNFIALTIHGVSQGEGLSEAMRNGNVPVYRSDLPEGVADLMDPRVDGLGHAQDNFIRRGAQILMKRRVEIREQLNEQYRQRSIDQRASTRSELENERAALAEAGLHLQSASKVREIRSSREMFSDDPDGGGADDI